MTDTRVLLERINAKSKVTPMAGVFVSYDANGPVVNVGDGQVTAAFASSYLPEVGERILLWFIDGVPYVMGPALPRPAVGTVTAVADSRVTLDTAVGEVGPLPYIGSAPVVDQTMRILWHGGGVAFAATDSVTPTPPPEPPATTKPRTTHADEFGATATGTWNTGGGDSATGYFNDEVWASNTTIGFWFYGSQTQDTIPADAAIQRVQLYISARQLYGGAPVFTVHGHTAPPGTVLNGGVAVGVSNGAWVDLPVSFGEALRSGGGAYGIGTRHGGYNIFNSRNRDGYSGRLRITSVY